MAEIIKVPVVVNVMKGVDVPPDRIQKVIEEANKILKPAGVQLDFDKDKNVTTGVDDTGNDVDMGDRVELLSRAIEELKKKCGEGKGYKIFFVRLIDSDPNVLGSSMHNIATSASFVKAEGKPEDLGQTVAHEACHVFTLGNGHKIDDHTKADASGHAEDKGNLMYPDRHRTGTSLTDDQKTEVQTGAKKRGDVVTEPPKKRWFSLHGGWGGLVRSEQPRLVDLGRGLLYAESPNADLYLQIDLQSLLSDKQDVALDFTVTFGPRTAAPVVLRTSLRGRYPFVEPAAAVSSLTVGAEVMSLSPATVERIVDITCIRHPGRSHGRADHDAVCQLFLVSALRDLPARTRATVVARDLRTGAVAKSGFALRLTAPFRNA